jgi:hypothetical protein
MSGQLKVSHPCVHPFLVRPLQCTAVCGAIGCRLAVRCCRLFDREAAFLGVRVCLQVWFRSLVWNCLLLHRTRTSTEVHSGLRNSLSMRAVEIEPKRGPEPIRGLILLGSRRNHATVQSYKRGWEVYMQLVAEVYSSECTAQQSRARLACIRRTCSMHAS